jgi:hypothetical protein
MINKLLLALSNREVFHEPFFKTSADFNPALISQEESTLRKQLYLDLTHTDYYLKIYLGLLHAYPDVEDNFNDNVRTYDVEDFSIHVVKMDGGEFLSSGKLQGLYLDPISDELPVNLRYEIHYYQPGYVRVLTRGVANILRCQTATDGKIIHVDWIDSLPFTGPIKVEVPWASGSVINITVEPRHFPYESMIARLNSSVYLMRLISEAGLVDEYVNTKDHQRKLAIALAVLAANNTAVYP